MVLYGDSDFVSNPADRQSVSGTLMIVRVVRCVLDPNSGDGRFFFWKRSIRHLFAWFAAFCFRQQRVGTATVYEDFMGALRLA